MAKDLSELRVAVDPTTQENLTALKEILSQKSKRAATLAEVVAWATEVTREKFDPIRPRLPFTRNSAEAYWGNDFTYKMSARVNFYENYRMFNNLTDTGQFRQNVDVGISAALTKWMTWNASVSDRYLSNPVPGRKRNDFLYTMGLGIMVRR